jgi:hypothetical protein
MKQALKLVSAVVVGGVASGAWADVPAPSAVDVQQWSALMFEYADTGQAATGAADFRFSNTGSNTVLMAPVRSAVRKLMSAKGIDVSNAECTATGVIAVADVEAFLVEGKIETSIYDVNKLLAHLEKTEQGQASGQSVAAAFVDGKFVTVGLDPATNTITPITSAPVPLDAELAAFMWQLAEVTGGIASSIDHSPKRVTDSLTGTTPYWAEFIYGLVGVSGSQGAPVGSKITTLEAAFGEWGSLVLARVDTGSHYFLVDTVNGAVSGPYEFTQAYDARSLLSTHAEYAASDSVEYFNAKGCPVTYPVADTLTLWPCPGPPPVPAGTCAIPAPFTPVTHPSRPLAPPGLPTDWRCVSAGTTCTCTSEYTYTAPAPCPVLTPPMVTRLCVIKLVTECTSAACPAASCAGGPNTGAPPAPGGIAVPGGGGMAVGCTPTCITKAYYYAQ